MSSRSGRLVSATNGVVAAGLVVVLAAVALVVKPPAPPGIAEFAPQATKPITKAPLGQSAEFGEGSGVCAVGQSCAPGQVPVGAATPSPGAAGSALAPPSAAEGVPSSLQCYTWPDGSVTQTYDPQSPPCVASWPEADQGNGGATSKGVTGTTVRLVVSPSHDNPALLRAYEAFFNTRFQLYGRRLQIVLGPQAVPRSDQEQTAYAKAAAELNAFAAVTHADAGPQNTLITSLASRGVIAVAGRAQAETTELPRRHGDFVWTYQPMVDTLLRHAGEAACKLLAGRDATWAGAGTRDQPRQFATIRRSPGNVPPVDPAPLRQTLASCGATLRVEDDPEDDGARVAMMLNLKQSGITTIFHLIDPVAGGWVRTAATRAGYQPEWFFPGLLLQDDARYINGSDDHATRSFGLASLNRHLSEAEEPSVRALHDGGYTGGAHPGKLLIARQLYSAMLLLASGIQAAGPNLTPTTFGDGLRQLRFPNPRAGTAPYYQASVGFDADDHAMIDDVGLWWWRPAANQTRGDLCYVRRGQRYQLGGWPTTDPGLFDANQGC